MSFNSADTPIDALSDWLMDQALSDPELEELVEGCNRRLHAAGIPVSRSIITSPILHPLYRSFTVLWTLEEGVETTYHVHDSVNRDEWKASPLHYVLQHRLPLLRRQLVGDSAVLDFPVLEELAERGMSDYVRAYLNNWVYGVEDRAAYWQKLGPEVHAQLQVASRPSETVNYGHY